MYQVLVLIHLISAITWLGGMLFLLMVMIPLARRDADVGFGTLRAAAEKFVPIAWAAKLVLAGSGAYLAWEYWNVRPDTFFTGSSHFLDYLQRKTGIFVIVVILSLVHDFWLGPRMMDRLEQARATGHMRSCPGDRAACSCSGPPASTWCWSSGSSPLPCG